MRQLSARDAAYVYLPETALSSRVLSCWVLAASGGGPAEMTADRIVPLLAGRLAVDDMFRSVLRRLPGDVDLPYWVLDPAVDPADHITVHEPCGMVWEQAQTLLSELADRDFDMDRPLWSVDVVIDVTGIPGQDGLATVLAVSFHHAAFDAIAWERRMHTLLADDPARHRPPIAVGPLDGPWWLTVVRAVLRMPAVWARFLGAAVGAVREARQRSRQSRVLYDRRRAPTTRFNTGVRGGRHTDFVDVDFAEIEAMAALAPGVTANDALLSIVGGALAGFLTAHAEPPDRSLICLVPKTTRRRGDRTADGDSGPANQFVPLTVDLHTDVPDVVARMAAVAASSRAEKDRAETVTTTAFWRAVTTAPAPLLRLSGAIARRRRPAPGGVTDVNTVLSTVVNETPVATVASIPVVSGFGFSPLGGETTLAHIAVIGLGRVRIIATADRTVLTDMSAYMRAMQASLDEHRAALRPVEVGSGGRVE